jgi:hypothetical protein
MTDLSPPIIHPPDTAKFEPVIQFEDSHADRPHDSAECAGESG